MKSLKIIVLTFVCIFALAAMGAAFSAYSETSAPVRNFAFTYVTRIPAPTLGAKTLRIWIPMPQSDPYQAIGSLKIESPFPYAKYRDPEYGNEYLYLQVPAAKVSSLEEVRMSFQVTRQEHRVELSPHPVSAQSAVVDATDLQRFLQPDRRVPLQGVIAELAAQETRGIQDPLAKARAIYNYVIATMRYDKSGTGWGRGDAKYACDVRTGNCTDFHSYFIALARSIGIPARFAIGATIPADRNEGTIEGYHCWAEFLADGRWVLVDISEAWKNPKLADYYFGHNPANRFELTKGRDLVVDPRPQSGPINFLAYPLLEMNGEVTKPETTFTFRRIGA